MAQHRGSMDVSVRRNLSKDYRDLLDRVVNQGWIITRTAGGHVACRSPEGRTAFCPGTSSDIRAIHRVRAKLRHAGATV